MPDLPDTIPVKFTEDLAQYADIRPVRRQPMTRKELVGLVLAVTGKHPERIREILRRGTCTYNIFRYWWDALELDPATLAALLAEFPDPDPARPFRPAACLWVRFSDARPPRPHLTVVTKEEAAARRWFRRQSLWDFLLAFAAARTPRYLDYSYYDRADVYWLEPSDLDRAALLGGIHRLARREIRRRLARPDLCARLELGCARDA